MLTLLKKLTAAYGPSGREDAIRAVIEKEIAPYVDEIKTDALGNLIALQKGEGPALLLAAHMDQIGFVVTDADEHGFLRVHNVGGIYRGNSLNRRVVFEDGKSGVVSREIEDDDPADKTMLRLFIDLGAKNREEALSKVQIGDMAVYAPDFAAMGEDLAVSPAMDNRAGCAVLIEALKKTRALGRPVWALFSAQEEVGLRGARAAAYGIDAQMALALDVTLTGDTPKGMKLPVKLGGGAAIKVMDSSLICTPSVVALLEKVAEKEGAPAQREVLRAGGTDAGAMHVTRAGIPAGVVSIPCRYVHSACETVSLTDMEAAVKIVAGFARDF